MRNSYSRRRATVLASLVVLLGATCLATTTISDVCIGLKAVSIAPTSQQQFTTPDELLGLDISDSTALAWVSPKDCTAGSKTVKSTGEWKNNQELCVSAAVEEVASCTDGKQRAVVEAVLNDDGTLTAQAGLEFSFTAKLRSGASVPVTGRVGFALSAVPVSLLGRIVPVWTGSMAGTSGSVTLRDSDLFDGVAPRVYEGAAGSASAETASAIEQIAILSTNVAGRVKFFEAVPSALSGDVTARLAFPDSSALLKVKPEDVTMIGSLAYAAPSAVCDGDACGTVVGHILKNFAESEGKCGSATVKHVHGSTMATVTVDTQTKKHSVVSAHAWVQGSLECSAGGNVLVTLEALSNTEGAGNSYDTEVFLQDPRAAITMTKSIEMILSGSRVAAVGNNGGKVYTTMEGNMFGHGRGGVFVDDVEINQATKTQFVSAVTDFANALKTGLSSLDSAVNKRLTRTAPEKVFENYLARTATPTGHGLWQYWANQVNGVEIMMDESASRDGLVANVDMTLRSAHLDFSASDPTFVRMNKVLGFLHDSVKGSTNLTAPVLSENTTYTMSTVDGAVSARIAIPKLTPGLALRGSTVSSWAKATVAAKFDDKCSLDNARLSLLLSTEIAADTPTVEYAVTNAAIGSKVVARSATGQVINDDAWSATNLKAIAKALDQVSASVDKDLSTSVQQFRQLTEGSSVTYSDLVTKIADILNNLPEGTRTVSDMTEKVRNALYTLVDKTNNLPFIASFAVTPNAGAQKIDFSFDVFAIRHINSEATSSEWKRTIPLPRLRVQTPTTSHLYFTASTMEGKVSQFTQKGQSTQAGWSLPVRSGMRPGLATGTASLSIDFPTSSLLIIDITGKMERGDAITGHFEGNMTVHMDESSTKLPSDFFQWTFAETNRGDYMQAVDPESAVHSFFDNALVFSSIPEHRLASPVPPFASRISEFFDISKVWDTQRAFFYTDSATPVLAAAKLQFPSAAFEEDYNFTINQNFNKWCAMKIPALTSKNAEQAFKSAIEACGISRYIKVSYVPDTESEENQNDEDESGRIVFMPSCPGIVHSFIVQCDSNTSAPLKAQTWTSGQTNPDALSWNDLYDSAYASFFMHNGIEYSAPTIQIIAVQDLALVDESRAEYYPKEFPAMLFTLPFKKEADAPAITIKSSVESKNLHTHFDLTDENYTVPAKVSGEFSTVYGYTFWCSLGDGSMNMSTSFSEVSESFENVIVPEAPKNTFQITLTYETRNKADVNARPALTSVHETIALKSGALVGQELLRLPSLLSDATVKRMVSVDKVVDPLREPVLTQVSMMFQPYVDESAGTIAVPMSISIDISDIPFWGSNETAVVTQTMTTCAVNKDFKTRFTVSTAPMTNDDATPCSGVTGIVSANATAKVSTQQTFVASTLNQYEFQANMISSVVDEKLFGRFFTSSADVSTTVDVSNFKFAVDRVSAADISSQVLRFVNNAKSLPFQNLSSLSNAKFDTDVASTGSSAPALKSLAASDRSHVCQAMNLANGASNKYANDKTNQESLPFVTDSVGPLFEQRMGSVVASVADTVCNDEGEMTLDPVCKTLSKGWGVQACAEAAIEDNALLLYVKAEPPQFKVDSGFKFDINKIIPFAKKQYTAGIGADGDFVLVATMSATFGLRFDFAKDLIAADSDNKNALTNRWVNVSLDPERTSFYAEANLDATSHVKASFGSIVLNFASAAVHLDGHVGAKWTEAKNIDFDIDGSASFKAGVSLEPIFSCNVEAGIPSLADFLFNKGNATWSEDCGRGKSFLDSLDSIADSMDFAKYFSQDPSLFWKQFSQNLNKIFDKLITKLLDRAVAFIGKQIQGLVHKALDGITGPEVADLVGEEIAEMVANIILNKTAPTGEDLERIVLQVFTGILNKRFGQYMLEPIPTPEPNPADGRYVWAMRWGQITTKPLANIDFHLGGHGLAQFGVQCQPELQLTWKVNFDVVWTKGKGIAIEWPVVPAFGGFITISANNDCTLEGRLLYLGAVLKAELKLDVALQVLANDTVTTKLEALEFYAKASITGEAQVGLVGILRSKSDESIANSLPALPHVKAGIIIEWGIDLRTDGKGQDTPFKFEFEDPKLCLGTLLTKFLRRVTDQIYKVVRPLLPVFGKNGILLKKIGLLKPFLHDHNDVLGIIELMCHFFSGSCNVKAVRALCETIRQVSDVLEKLQLFQEWLGSDETGCARFDVVYKTFGVNWTKKEPKPEQPTSLALRDWDEEGHYEFPYDFDPNQKAQLITETTGWQTGGEFKFTLDIMQKFPTKFIKILLGGNLPLFSFSFPYASFGFSTSWSIPVWAFPYVGIVVYATAKIEFHPPPIALMSNALVDTIRTGNPSHIFRNLAIRSLQDNGQPYFFINGYIEVGGGAEVGIKVFIASITGEATLFIRFSAGIAVVSVNGEEWTTFDTIALQLRTQGLKGTVDIELKFTGGFRIALKACIKLIFKKKCWTVASKSWSKDFGSWSFKPKAMDRLSDNDGDINGDAANDNIPSMDPAGADVLGDTIYASKYARFTITPTNVMLLARTQTDADAPRTRKLSANPSVRFRGNVCQNPISVAVVGDINFPIQLPNCGNSFLNVSQHNYDSSASSFQLTSKTIRAGERPPITFSDAWESALLSEAAFGTEYETTGVPPCPVTIETGEMSTLTVKGSPSDYGSRMLEMKGGLREATSTALCSDFVVDMDSFTCTSQGSNGGVNLRVPSTLRSFAAYAQTPEESVFHIMGTSPRREVTLTSATSYSNFSVPDMATIQGYTDCIGNSAGQMYLLATMKTLKNAPAEIVLTSSHAQLDNGDGQNHMVHHTNVPFREYDILGANAQKTTTKLLPPTEFDVVTLRSHGAANSEMTHYVTGCHVRSGLEVRLDGDGMQTVVFGDKDGLKTSACSANVVSLSNTLTSTIFVNATRDSRQLRWEFRPGKLSVSTLEEHADTFQVLYDNINRVTVNFGEDSSDVFIDTQDESTEFVLNFQETDGPVQNTLKVSGSPAAVLVNGPVKRVVVGTPDSGMKTPFEDLHGVLAIASDAHIVLDTAHNADSPAQHFTMDGNCLVEEGQTLKEMSQWMTGQMTQSGLKPRACSLLYNSAAQQSLEVRTGGGADSFMVDGATIPVTLDLGANADKVSLKNAEGVPFVVNLGDGADRLDIKLTGNVKADLGNDRLTDIVNVYYTDRSPSIEGTTIYPVGKDNAKLELTNWLQQDMISVLRDGDKRNQNSRFRADSVLIEATVPSSKLHYEQQSDTTYIVTKCASMCSVSFDAYSSTSPDVAKNAWVYSRVNDVSTVCALIINSDLTANGTVGVLVPEDMKTMPSRVSMSKNVEPLGTGTITVGLLELRPVNISHIELAIPALESVTAATVAVDDVPDGADLLVATPGPEWTVDLKSVRSSVVVLDATTNVSAQTLYNRVAVIAAGSSGKSVVHVDATRTQSVRFVGGCLLNAEGPKSQPVSDWLIWHTQNEYKVWIGTYHQCNVDVQNVSSVHIRNTDTIAVGNLDKTSTTHLVIENSKALNLTVEPALVSTDPVKSYVDWKAVKYLGTNDTNRLTVTRTNDEVFVIDATASETITVTPGISVWADGTVVDLDCASSSVPTRLNLARDYDEKTLLHATMKVSSMQCTASINNMVSKNTALAPIVNLGDSLMMNLSITTLSPETETETETEDAEEDAETQRFLDIRIDGLQTVYSLTEGANKSNRKQLVKATWPTSGTQEILHDLGDDARYVLDFDAPIIDASLVRLRVGAGAALGFGELNGATVLFRDAQTSQYKPETRKFSLSPGKNDYCFDPCQDCTDGAWGKVVVSGKVCQPRSAQDSCKQRAKIVVNITGELEGVSCGAAAWDSGRNATCPFAMNVDGKASGVLEVPSRVTLATTVIIAVSAGLTILGASSLLARIVFSAKRYTTLNSWWTQNTFRDLLTDQFSWAAIVITACLPEIADVDYAKWGGPVVAIMLRAKTFVLNWFVTCSETGDPVWVTPATIVFWSVSGVSVVLRVVELVVHKRDVVLSGPVQNVLLAVQSVVTIAGFLLLPLVGYSLAFLSQTSYIGFASLACMLLLFLSQPIGKVSRTCVSGITASVVNVLLPVSLCVYVGVGARFLPLIVAALVLAVLLPVIDLVVLWFAFFRKAVYHNAAWKNSIAWTIVLRVLSMLSGVAFIALLFFNLDSRLSYIAAGLWFGWVCTPFLALVPLTAGVPAVLSNTQVIPSKMFRSDGESSPLLGHLDESGQDL